MNQKSLKQFMSFTTNNLNQIKGQLEVFNIENDIADNSDLQVLYGRLHNQIKNFENTLTSKMVQFDQIEKGKIKGDVLPPIHKKSLSQSDVIQKRFSEKSYENKGIEHERRKNPIKNSDYIQTVLRTKFISKPPSETTEKNKQAELTQQQQGQSSQIHLEHVMQLQKSKAKSRLAPRPQILSKELRKNPFVTAPPITENDLRKGLCNLVSKGVIPKDVDLTPAFERGVPPLSRAQAKLIPFQEKHKPHVQIDTGVQNMHMHESSAATFITQQQQIQQQQSLEQAKQPRLNKTQKLELKLKYSELAAQKQLQEVQLEQDKETMTYQIKKMKTEYQFYSTIGNYTFTIKNGKTDESSIEYQSFLEQNLFQWGPIYDIIHKLEKLFQQRCIKIAYIDCKRLIALSQELKQVSLSQMLSIVKNKEIVEQALKIPQKMFIYEDGQARAVNKIQTYFRMKQAINNLKQLKDWNKKVQRIQVQFKLVLHYQKTKTQITKNLQKMHEEAQVMEQEFKKQWDKIKKFNRVEVHLSSLSREQMQRQTMEKFEQKQNMQIARVFALKDPNVDIIYVSQLELSNDLISYYTKILELGGVTDFKERLHFITPENAGKFPRYFPINKLLLYSPIAIQKIKTIIANRPAYIFSGFPSEDDVYLMHYLGIPLYSGTPEKHQLVCSKAGSQKIFQLCGIPSPPSAQPQQNENAVIDALTSLIYANQETSNWIFKINDEFCGRGLATFSMDSIKLLQDLVRNPNISEKGKLEKIKEIIQTLLPLKLRPSMPTLYKSYNEYIKMFTQKGGIIEAMPSRQPHKPTSVSVFLNIEPNGNVNVLGTCDRITGADYINVACISPQKALPQLNVLQLSTILGNQLYRLGIFGYASFDMIAFTDHKKPDEHPLFWAIGLDCYLNNYSSIFFYFDFLMQGKVDQSTGSYFLTNNNILSQNTQAAEQSDMLNSNLQQVQVQAQASIQNQNNNNLSYNQSLVQQQPNFLMNQQQNAQQDTMQSEKSKERSFMYCPFIFHQALQVFQFKDLFQQCRLEQISFDLEKKIGSTFLLFDLLQFGVLGILTIGEDRKQVVKFMTDSLNFIITQTGPPKMQYGEGMEGFRYDTIFLLDILNQVRYLKRTIEGQDIF